jgi:hypothetical protein
METKEGALLTLPLDGALLRDDFFAKLSCREGELTEEEVLEGGLLRL